MHSQGIYRRCTVRKGVLKRYSFLIKLQAWHATLLKVGSGIGVFL